MTRIYREYSYIEHSYIEYLLYLLSGSSTTPTRHLAPTIISLIHNFYVNKLYVLGRKWLNVPIVKSTLVNGDAETLQRRTSAYRDASVDALNRAGRNGHLNPDREGAVFGPSFMRRRWKKEEPVWGIFEKSLHQADAKYSPPN